MRRHLHDAASREEPDAGRADDLALRHHRLARLRLFPGLAHVGAHGGGGGERHAAAGLAVAGHHVDDLVFHHGVCVVGHGRAGHDAHALPGLDRAFKHVARRDLGHDVQFDRRFLRRLDKLGGPNREPVHRRMGERRDVDIALQIGGGHAADRFQHGHGFHRQGRRMGQHERTGLFK